MEFNTLRGDKLTPEALIENCAAYIKSLQLDSGAIPWFHQHTLDPWDHSEAIMALSVAGERDAVRSAFLWLATNQNSDGSWYAKYLGDADDKDLDRYKIETNFVAYPATALWHAYLCSGDHTLIEHFFPVITRAIDYVVGKQSAEGDIQWACSEQESLPSDALLTACASILRSLESALKLAEKQKIEKPHWRSAYQQLAHALKNKPWRFDRTWDSKARFSMDWFYPVLSGVYSETEAKLRLAQSWQKFVVDEFGCRCVSDEDWITVAESCELVIALTASGARNTAAELLAKLLRWQDKDGGFWTGYQFRDQCIWPEEKTTWTAAAVVLACDAVYQVSPAAQLFTAASTLLFERGASQPSFNL